MLRPVLRIVTLTAAIPVLFLLACSLGEKVPTGEEIIDRHLAAVGGTEALGKLQNRVTKGSFTLPDMGGFEGQVTMYVVPPDRSYTEILQADGKTVLYRAGVTDGIAWRVDPMGGPQKLDQIEKEQALRDITLERLANWKEVYDEAVVDPESLDPEAGRTKVTLNSKDAGMLICFFEKATGLLTRFVSAGESGRIMIDFNDYKTVDGVSVPHFQRSSTQQVVFEVRLTEVKHNVEIPEETFALPPEIERLIN